MEGYLARKIDETNRCLLRVIHPLIFFDVVVIMACVVVAVEVWCQRNERTFRLTSEMIRAGVRFSSHFGDVSRVTKLNFATDPFDDEADNETAGR